MTGHYSAAASDSQSTRPSEVISAATLLLGQASNATGGNILQVLEPQGPRGVESLLPVDCPPKPGRKTTCKQVGGPSHTTWGRFCERFGWASLNQLRCVELVSGVSTGQSGKNRRFPDSRTFPPAKQTQGVNQTRSSLSPSSGTAALASVRNATRISGPVRPAHTTARQCAICIRSPPTRKPFARCFG